MSNSNKNDCMPIDIFHIYWGTSGNAGLYLDEIYQSLKQKGFNQQVFVSYYYPFDYGEKIFFRWTDLGHSNLKKCRGMIRYVELIRALLRIYYLILKNKPTIVNYSLIGSYAPVLLFIKAVKKFTNSTLVITCHDVCPFQNSFMNISHEKKRRQIIFELADYLLVHNDNSKMDLYNYYKIRHNKIIMHPFPLMDIKKICKLEPVNKEYDFLFIGHLRVEKGIFLLLDAWNQFHELYPEATLCVAGNLPSGMKLNIYDYIPQNITFELRFLSDEDYCKLIISSHCVILPYISGTNSGIVSTVLSLNSDILASDIPMFKNNPMLDEASLFKSESALSLVELLKRKITNITLKGMNKIDVYKKTFDTQVYKVYKDICDTY